MKKVNWLEDNVKGKRLWNEQMDRDSCVIPDRMSQYRTCFVDSEGEYYPLRCQWFYWEPPKEGKPALIFLKYTHTIVKSTKTFCSYQEAEDYFKYIHSPFIHWPADDVWIGDEVKELGK